MPAERKNLIYLATETLLLFSLAHSSQPVEASNSTLQACPAGEGGKKGTIIVEGSNVRSGPTTKSERVLYLRQGTALTVVDVYDGESVSQLGKSDDHWDRVRLEDCTEGFIWAPLVDTDEERIYNKLVFAHCPYQPDNVSSVKYEERDWWKSEALVAQDINSTMVALNSWKGRNIWLGYPDEVPPGAPSGFDMPEDAESIGKIKLTLKENTVANQKVYDDYTEIWLYEGEKEVYVFAFVSLTVEFARADGEYMGYHGCGAYAVPPEYIDSMKDLFKFS